MTASLYEYPLRISIVTAEVTSSGDLPLPYYLWDEPVHVTRASYQRAPVALDPGAPSDAPARMTVVCDFEVRVVLKDAVPPGVDLARLAVSCTDDVVLKIGSPPVEFEYEQVEFFTPLKATRVGPAISMVKPHDLEAAPLPPRPEDVVVIPSFALLTEGRRNVMPPSPARESKLTCLDDPASEREAKALTSPRDVFDEDLRAHRAWAELRAKNPLPPSVSTVEPTSSYTYREAACDAVGEGRVQKLEELLPGFSEWLNNLGVIPDQEDSNG